MSISMHLQQQTHLRMALLIVALLLSGSGQCTEIEARISRNPVSVDESFQLILQSDGTIDSDPDFSVLEQDFRTLSQSQSQNIQMINGKVARSTTWNLTLMARHAGRLNIPAIPFGTDSSKPLSIQVENAKPPQQGMTGDDIFLKVEAKPAQAYQGEQILLGVQLYRALSTDNASLSQPVTDDPDILVKKLGEDEQYETMIAGRRYLVVERRYALFSQKTGTLNLAPIVFQGEVIKPDSRRGGLFGSPFGRFGAPGELRRVQSNPIAIPIQPAPDQTAGEPWLPSSNLQLVENWSRESRQFTVGEPVTRTLMLFADGLSSAQLPDIKIELPEGLKQYPDQPQLSDRESRDGITGIRQFKVAIVPSRSGRFTLPPINLKWWNLTKKRMETAIIPEQQIEVLPAAADEQRAVSPALSEHPSSTQPEQQVKSSASNEAAIYTWLWAVALFLGIGWIGTSIAWLYSAKKNRSTDSLKKAKHSKPPKADKRALHAACLANDPEAAGKALLAWGRCFWPDAPPGTLGGIAEKSANAGLKKEIERLERSLYAENSSPWNGAELWRQLEKEPGTDSGKAGSEEIIAPLYPS